MRFLLTVILSLFISAIVIRCTSDNFIDNGLKTRSEVVTPDPDPDINGIGIFCHGLTEASATCFPVTDCDLLDSPCKGWEGDTANGCSCKNMPSDWILVDPSKVIDFVNSNSYRNFNNLYSTEIGKLGIRILDKSGAVVKFYELKEFSGGNDYITKILFRGNKTFKLCRYNKSEALNGNLIKLKVENY